MEKTNGIVFFGSPTVALSYSNVDCVKLLRGFSHEMLGVGLCVSHVCLSFAGFGLIKLDLKTKSENGLVSSQWISVIHAVYNAIFLIKPDEIKVLSEIFWIKLICLDS